MRRAKIKVKSTADIEKMRLACRLTAEALREIENNLYAGMTTGMIDKIAEDYILAHDGRPTFKGYHGFPAATCISINDELIHGIPGERIVKPGDVVSIDVGVTINGFNGDAARTFAVGPVRPELEQLISAAKTTFERGCSVLKAGKKIGDMSCLMQQYAESNGYGVVKEFVGHGIGRALHEPPEIPNYGLAGTGMTIPAGATLAIEPMITLGNSAVKVLKDNWTVVTCDGKASAHYENTVLVTEEGFEILTKCH